MDILTKIYRCQDVFNFIGFSGMFFPVAANGSQALVGFVPSAGQIQYQDQSGNNSLWIASVAGVDSNGQLVRADPSTDFIVIPGGIQVSPPSVRPYWLPPTAAPSLQTYIIGYGISLWAGLRPPQVDLTRRYDALISMAFTASSLDTFLQQITTTPNEILALVDGHTGVVVASSAPNSSVVWPTQFPAVGNPNAMLSAASAQLLALYSSGSANDTTSFGQITDRSSQRFSFSFAGDTVYCSTSWITDDAAMLSLVLVLVVPAQDLLGALATTTRNSIIFVALFTSFAFGLGGLLAWAMVVPIRRVTSSINQATKFDFDSLQGGLLAHASWMTEIIELEDAFSAMLVKFAGAVDSNKLLVGQSPASSKRGSRIPQTIINI
ncbi:hypothetical protein HK405_005521 [Cladochytrium tenue]|nr:hypothetical protein HK405_005521 [Cladochytrium tenue]